MFARLRFDQRSGQTAARWNVGSETAGTDRLRTNGLSEGRGQFATTGNGFRIRGEDNSLGMIEMPSAKAASAKTKSHMKDMPEMNK